MPAESIEKVIRKKVNGLLYYQHSLKKIVRDFLPQTN